MKKNRKKKVNSPLYMRTSDMLRTLKTKAIKGLGASNNEPFMIPGDEEGTLTQEPAVVAPNPRPGTCFKALRSWNDISRRFSQ